jgi:hypothetical protein
VGGHRQGDAEGSARLPGREVAEDWHRGERRGRRAHAEAAPFIACTVLRDGQWARFRPTFTSGGGRPSLKGQNPPGGIAPATGPVQAGRRRIVRAGRSRRRARSSRRAEGTRLRRWRDRVESSPGERFDNDWGHLGALTYNGASRKLYAFGPVEESCGASSLDRCSQARCARNGVNSLQLAAWVRSPPDTKSRADSPAPDATECHTISGASTREVIARELEQLPEQDLNKLLAFLRSLKDTHAENAVPTLAAESALAKGWLTAEQDAPGPGCKRRCRSPQLPVL